MHSLYVTLISLFTQSVIAATADQWKSRSIYQVLTDRFAPSPNSPSHCDTSRQTWCGGTWNSIRDNLDYIQDAGFTAVWISPIAQNYDGPRTPYGDAYHGYWVEDNTKLNPHFGTYNDLKALSDELHRRDMYLMVDVVVNNVMSTSVELDYSKFMFKDPELYRSYCPIIWGDPFSEKYCWLGDEKVYLPDIDTENPVVAEKYNQWIRDLVSVFRIDGLRIDAAKHTKAEFWGPFCEASGVFCMGEVFGDDFEYAASFQSPSSLDSVLHYPMYNALVDAFAIPGPQNMSSLTETMSVSKDMFRDVSLLGNFIENHDLPRWSNFSVDPQSKWNAMTFNFLSRGIPIVYYGQEQGFSGHGDPHNREALWTSSYASSETYQFMSKLNKFRNHIINTTDWLSSDVRILESTSASIAFARDRVITVLTNVGSPPNNESIAFHSMRNAQASVTDVISCRRFTVGSEGMLNIEYSKGGVPLVLVSSSDLDNSGLCGFAIQQAQFYESSAEQNIAVGYMVAFIALLIGLVH